MVSNKEEIHYWGSFNSNWDICLDNKNNNVARFLSTLRSLSSLYNYLQWTFDKVICRNYYGVYRELSLVDWITIINRLYKEEEQALKLIFLPE